MPMTRVLSLLLIISVSLIQINASTKYIIDLPETFVSSLKKNGEDKVELWHP